MLVSFKLGLREDPQNVEIHRGRPNSKTKREQNIYTYIYIYIFFTPPHIGSIVGVIEGDTRSLDPTNGGVSFAFSFPLL